MPPNPCPSVGRRLLQCTPGRSCDMGKVAHRLGRTDFLLALGNAMGAGREGTTLSSCLKRAPRQQATSLTRQGWTGHAGPHPQYSKLMCGMRLLALESGTTPWEDGGGRRRRRKAFLGQGFSSQDHRDILPSYCAPQGPPVPQCQLQGELRRERGPSSLSVWGQAGSVQFPHNACSQTFPAFPGGHPAPASVYSSDPVEPSSVAPM